MYLDSSPLSFLDVSLSNALPRIVTADVAGMVAITLQTANGRALMDACTILKRAAGIGVLSSLFGSEILNCETNLLTVRSLVG